MILICNLIGLIFPFWYFSILLNMIKVEGFIFPKCQKEKKKTAKKEKKKKSLHEEMNSRPLHSALKCSITEPQRL